MPTWKVSDQGAEEVGTADDALPSKTLTGAANQARSEMLAMRWARLAKAISCGRAISKRMWVWVRQKWMLWVEMGVVRVSVEMGIGVDVGVRTV
jgi:hypothetical protein